MTLPDCKEILLNRRDGVLSLTFNRPHKRNAMNDRLVSEVMDVFGHIRDDRGVRAVILRGAGGHFCAGGDLSGMTAAGDGGDGEQAVWSFNRNFGRMISAVNGAPQVVIALLEGAVMGGGFGLACVSDVAIADRGAAFAMPETGLGLIPAQIAPFVVARTGLTHARRLTLLGERIDGEEAVRLGIAHFLTHSAAEMDEKCAEVIRRVRRCAPEATAATKTLVLSVGHTDPDVLLDEAATAFSTALNSEEGQEGTRAFTEKRKPSWVVDHG